MNDQIFMLELKKRNDGTVVKVTTQMIQSNPEKVLQILVKECVDLKTWFSIIVKFVIILRFIYFQ
jgi:hypothetical protein